VSLSSSFARTSCLSLIGQLLWGGRGYQDTETQKRRTSLAYILLLLPVPKSIMMCLFLKVEEHSHPCQNRVS
jgi:hypothetical protein